jgi:hypothetical protein
MQYSSVIQLPIWVWDHVQVMWLVHYGIGKRTPTRPDYALAMNFFVAPAILK